MNPYPDGCYCSTVCGSQCCRHVDVYVLRSEEVSYEFFKANYPGLGARTCGCLGDDGLCRIHDGPRPVVCRIFPYFLYDGAVMASLNCRYVREKVLPAIDGHMTRDRLFKEITEFLHCQCSSEQLSEIQQHLARRKGVFLLIRGNLDA